MSTLGRGTGSTGRSGGTGATGRTSDTGALTIHKVPAEEAAGRALALLQEQLGCGSPAADLAVLARVNSALLPVQVVLTEAGVAHTAPLGPSVLGRTGVRTALAYLRLGLEPDRIRREDVLETINRPARKVRSAVTPLLRRSTRWSLAGLEQLADHLDAPHDERFRGYLGDLHHLAAAIEAGADTAACLTIVRDRIGLGEAMHALDASRRRPEGSSHGDDLDALTQLASLHPRPAGFGTWLAERLRAPADPTGVTLSTVHRVKGMEWDRVVVFAANQGLFPHRLAEDVEEERRVFHVAITRCRRAVDLIADERRASPFLAELVEPAQRASRRGDQGREPPPRTEPTRVDGGIVAEPGLEVTLAGGFTGRVVEVGREDAVVLLPQPSGAGLELVVALGERVRVGGEPTTLVTPPRRGRTAGGAAAGRDGSLLSAGRRTERPAPGAPADPGTTNDGDDLSGDALFEALRSWRAAVAADTGVPAFLVFHDRHLQAIAGRRPRTLRELAACPGVGPAKLERFGDDVLDIVDRYG